MHELSNLGERDSLRIKDLRARTVELRVLAALPALSLQIVEFAREHGRVTIGGAMTLTGVSRNTLKQHFRQLVERGHLNQQGSGRGVWYELK